MSFSFNFVASTKAAAKTRITEEMSKVLQYSIEHARDLPAAIAVGHAYIDVLTEDPEKDISVSMYGSLATWDYEKNAQGSVTSAGVTVSVGHTLKPPVSA